MRYIAPAGTPIGLRDLGGWLYNAAAAGDIIEKFRQGICSTYNVKHCFFLSTGRAALCLLLESLKELSGDEKDEIVIPSYDCFSVPSSAVKTDLKIRICDVDANTLDYDPEKLATTDFSKVLCIITSNLYGIPNDLKYISGIARDNGVFLIDDAAQCMGGAVDGRFSGTWGDAGFYSLDKGKNITSIQGGIIVTNSDEIASIIGKRMNSVQETSAMECAMIILKLIYYSIFLHPGLYWIPKSLPFLKLGTTIYTTEYPVASYNPSLAAMAFRLFQKLNEINKIRAENAMILKDSLSGLRGLKLARHGENVSPVYLRFPVLVQDGQLRSSIICRLNRAGIGATASYPTPINDIKEIQDMIVNKESPIHGGRKVSGEIVTLPTHPYVTESDINTMVTEINNAVCGSGK